MADTTKPTRPSGRSRTKRSELPDMETLLDAMSNVPPFFIVGFARVKGELEVGFTPMREDPRATAAGMFGFCAPRSWFAAGVKIVGTARNMETYESPGSAESAVVVTRSGEIGSFLEIDGVRESDSGVPHNGASNMAEAPQGALVDALHRVLGIGCPGPEIPSSTVVLSLWLDDIAQLALATGSITWDQAARIHPLAAHNALIPPSVEMIVEATCRAENVVNWDRLRRRAIMGSGDPVNLSVEELRWMDTTMFSRWTVGGFPDPRQIIALVGELGDVTAAQSLVSAIKEIVRRGSEPSETSTVTKSA